MCTGVAINWRIMRQALVWPSEVEEEGWREATLVGSVWGTRIWVAFGSGGRGRGHRGWMNIEEERLIGVVWGHAPRHCGGGRGNQTQEVRRSCNTYPSAPLGTSGHFGRVCEHQAQEDTPCAGMTIGCGGRGRRWQNWR